MINKLISVQSNKFGRIYSIAFINIDLGGTVLLYYLERHSDMPLAVFSNFFKQHFFARQRIGGMKPIGLELKRVPLLIAYVIVRAAHNLHRSLHQHLEPIQLGYLQIVRVIVIVAHRMIYEVLKILIILFKQYLLVCFAPETFFIVHEIVAQLDVLGSAFNNGHVNTVLAFHGQAQAVCFQIGLCPWSFQINVLVLSAQVDLVIFIYSFVAWVPFLLANVVKRFVCLFGPLLVVELFFAFDFRHNVLHIID